MRSPRRQSGYMLLLMIIIFMGIGGLVLTGFAKSSRDLVDEQRYLRNQRILEEAKQALLMYAYNYPDIAQRGPGRLPCPDMDDSGTPNQLGTDCIAVGPVAQVGRFPWNVAGMNFYDIRDSSGERLWYAVSENFSNFDPGDIINSDTTGTITLVDQSGNIIYDGNGSGIAAVIIAPGSIVRRDQDNNGTYEFTQLRGTALQQLDPRNYLDTFSVPADGANNQFDNSVFNNAESDSNDDGFILGPIFDTAQGDFVVNDQIIVITADEVLEMAEKRTLEAYRDALNTYDQRIDAGVGPGDYFPWLFNYAVNEIGDGYPELDEYPSEALFADELANYLGRRGRVPSIYTSYFSETDGQPIESRLGIELTLSYPISPTLVGFDETFPAIGAGTFEFDIAPDQTINLTSTDHLTNVVFTDTDPNVFSANDGRLSADVPAAETFTDVRYYWDEEPVGDGWEICPAGADDITDCNRDDEGDPDPGGDNDTASQILRVQYEIVLNGTINFDIDYAADPAPAIINAAGGGQHARIRATINGANVDSNTLPAVVNYEMDAFYLNGFDVQRSGTLSLGDLIQGGSLELTMRYYPELPAWVFDNGWYDSVQFAYANDYRPGGPGGPCTAGTDCLQIANSEGPTNDKISLLAIAGQHDWDDEANDGLADDVTDIFAIENDPINDLFDARVFGSRDRIMVVDEL